MASKWIMVEGVPGKLCDVPDGPAGVYYGMREKVLPADAVDATEYDRFEPFATVYPIHPNVIRACRKRLQGDGVSTTPKEVCDLIQIGEIVTAATREDAWKAILDKLPEGWSETPGLKAARERIAAKAKAAEAAKAKAEADAKAKAAKAEADAKAKAAKARTGKIDDGLTSEG